MQKLLITLILVGGIISGSGVAQGMDLEISVNGDLDPCDYEVVLQPGETAVLNIHSLTGYVTGDDVYFALVVDTNYGNISGGVVTAEAPPDSGIYGDDAQASGLCSPPEDGVWGALTSLGCHPRPPGVYVDEMIFHCVAEGDAIIHLWITVDFANFTLEDTVIIQQATDCVKSDAPFYDEWVGAGKPWSKPDCWCFRRHCRGDADGIRTGPFWVAIPDLTLFRACYNKFDYQLTQDTICGDFDHKKTGPFRCGIPDLNLLRMYHSKTEVMIPLCPMDWDGDGDDDYNFWKN